MEHESWPISECLPDAVVVLDAQRRIVHVNPRCESLFGYPQAELLGAPIECLFRDPPEDPKCEQPASVDAAFRDATAGESLELRGLRKNNSQFPVEVRVGAMPLASGPGMVIVVRGTARKEHETEAADCQRLALQAVRLTAIGETVTGLAHESRNALQRSQACLDMLAHRVRDLPKETELVQRIQQAQDRLQSLHDQLQKYAGPIRLNRKPCALHEILHAAWESLSDLRRERETRLMLSARLEELHCEADALALEQAFRNLLENSLSDCPDPVVIQIEGSPGQWKGLPAVVVSVVDNGPGFPADQKDKLFQPFFTTKTRGTGLGLAISKRLIEAHGGAIDIGWGSSAGAEVIVTLPQHTGATA